MSYASGKHEADNLKPFNFSALIENKTKEEEVALRIADAIANSLYNSCITNKYDDVETRYLDCMKNIFVSGNDGKILNYGIKPVIDYSAMQLPLEAKSYIFNLSNSVNVKQEKAA